MQFFFRDFFLYLTISSSFLFTGCIEREYNHTYYNPKPAPNPFQTNETIKRKKSYSNGSCKPHYIIKYQPYPNYTPPAPLNYKAQKKESAFDKILKANRDKKVKKISRVRYNNSQEEFPSNVPIGSIK